MAIETINGTPFVNISEVKKSPGKFFKETKETKEALYVMSNNSVAGLIVDKDVYENMIKLIEELEEKLLYAEAERRIQKHDSDPDSKTYTTEEVLGHDLSDVEWSENDGWE